MIKPHLLLVATVLASPALAQPVIQINVLKNGDFDAYGRKGLFAEIPSDGRENWRKFLADGDMDYDLAYNADLYLPPEGTPSPPNYGGAIVHYGYGNHARAIQTVSGLAPDDTVTVSGLIYGCHEANADIEHRVLLWDWDGVAPLPPAGSHEIGAYRMPDADECASRWLAFSFTATVPASGTVTVDFGYELVTGSEWNSQATQVDNLELSVPYTCPQPYGDADSDGDVDAEDFGEWQKCFTGSGPGAPSATGHCLCLDADGDRHVGSADFDAFTGCATGPGVPQTDPDCGIISACCDGESSPGPSTADIENAGGLPQGENTRCDGATCP